MLHSRNNYSNYIPIKNKNTGTQNYTVHLGTMMANQNMPSKHYRKLSVGVGEDIKVGDRYKRRGKGESERGRSLI